MRLLEQNTGSFCFFPGKYHFFKGHWIYLFFFPGKKSMEINGATAGNSRCMEDTKKSTFDFTFQNRTLGSAHLSEGLISGADVGVPL